MLRFRTVLSLTALVLSSALLAETPAAPADATVQGQATYSPQALAAHRNAFIAQDDFPKQLSRLIELEQQALQLAVDEPLKLGSIGSAILDIYPASQTGHYAMSRFYAHVESSDAQAQHDRHLEAIQAQMLATAAGSIERPYPVMTPMDAHAYAQSQNASPVGSMYRTTPEVALGLLLMAQPFQSEAQRSLRQWYFDLSHVVERTAKNTPEHNPQASAWTLIRLFASRMDNAAQTAIGAYLASAQKYEDAIGWLRVASRTDNVLANTLLARIYWTQAEAAADDDEKSELMDLALENHLHAIALGSTESMYTLANLYLNDYYGEDDRGSAIPLLQQAGELDHAESLLYLGHLYNTGTHVEQDQMRASDYFEKAAELNNGPAILSYARFLTGNSRNPDASTHPDTNPQLIDWLKALAKADSADASEAMVVLGNLYARGIGTKSSNRRAFSWYKRAVKRDPENADIVNEVAWTLTVSDINGLKRSKYARKVMDTLMNSDEKARNRPEYLDTWAAIYAAIGEFPRAIELQKEAIATAKEQSRDDVLEILETHLKQFEAGDTITEAAP